MFEEYNQYLSESVLNGKVCFPNKEVPFLQFAHDADMDDVRYVMTKILKLPTPQIVLVVVSDIGPLTGWQSSKQQSDFVKGLIKGSNATQMWVLTYGLNLGIAKVIGDAFQFDFENRHWHLCEYDPDDSNSSKAVLIGLCREDILTYSEKFEELTPIVKIKNEGNKPEEMRYDLNPNHTHFFIIKDKTVRKDGVDRFLLRLQDCFGKLTLDYVDEYFEAPIVAILIQGDAGSVHFILAHLKRRLPLLVIKGSGGLADLIAFAHYEVTKRHQKVKDADYVENVLKSGLSNKIVAVFPNLKDNKTSCNLLCDRILECIKYSEQVGMQHITVLNLLDLKCKLENLPVLLLEALFKSRKSDVVDNFHDQKRKDLELTIHWNCPEVATSEVFFKDPKFKIPPLMFEGALLREDREAFISLFLENGFPLHKHLSSTRLKRLFKQSLQETFFREICWEGVLGYGQVTELDDNFIDLDLNWLIEKLTGIPIYISSKTLNLSSIGFYGLKSSKKHDPDVSERKAFVVLIIWAVLSNRGTLAKIIWRHCDQPVMLALYSSLLLDRMANFAHERERKQQLRQLSGEFASMATGVFDLCYNDLPSRAYESLNTKNIEWGKHSVIDIASFAENRTFMAHPCCQKWLTNMFMGNVRFRELTWGFVTLPLYIKVLLSAFLIFPMYLWVRFHIPDDHIVEQDYDSGELYYLSESQRKAKKNERRNTIAQIASPKYIFPSICTMIHSLWSAPITIFWVSNLFYILYLSLFSVAVIWPSCGALYLDIVVCTWTFLIAVDCFYRITLLHEAFPNMPMFLRCIELLYMLIFVFLYATFRIIFGGGRSNPYSAKVLLCFGLLYFYYRMIFLYLPISSTLGPLLYRVDRMVRVDFVNFMRLTLLIMISNGIVMHAMLYPDYPLCSQALRKTFHTAWSAFFITPLDDVLDTQPGCVPWIKKPMNSSFCRISSYTDYTCSDPGILSYFLTFQYLLFFKLILVTVLFALFNNTGAQLQNESDSLWKFQRYQLIVNFAYCLRLPPPVNICSVILTILKGIKDIFMEKPKETDEETTTKPMSGYEYDYWRQLASDFYVMQENLKQEQEFEKKELDLMFELSENVNIKDNMLHKAKSQIAELEADISYTHTFLETFKYRAAKGFDAKNDSVHILSRESPYPLTKIQRFPVPDKYVPWEVTWMHYEPTVYTMPRKRFPLQVQSYADEDTPLDSNSIKVVVPNYNWNIASLDSAGFYRNRQSWITDNSGEIITYKLDKEGLPKNPMGRTGLKGKGSLPRWGPNHNIFTVITRWSTTSITLQLEFVETWFRRKTDLSLPGGFAWPESPYSVIQSIFKMKNLDATWTTADEMTKFFELCAIKPAEEDEKTNYFLCDQVFRGYMDDSLNTDQAWKEVELWHVHYNTQTTIDVKFTTKTGWRMLSEDVFIQLPHGQTLLLQQAIRALHAKEPKSRNFTFSKAY